ncbi:hypothetical protein JQN58_20210 [Aneurinibacillus sp. BA2021]|nr:hypothetical protein [Aneurinibacillus sp. BA2021]
MEHLLYYNDPYITQCRARLLHQAQDEEGRWYAILNQTPFYPTGGGQTDKAPEAVLAHLIQLGTEKIS